jgi:hypothetical protein
MCSQQLVAFKADHQVRLRSMSRFHLHLGVSQVDHQARFHGSKADVCRPVLLLRRNSHTGQRTSTNYAAFVHGLFAVQRLVFSIR